MMKRTGWVLVGLVVLAGCGSAKTSTKAISTTTSPPTVGTATTVATTTAPTAPPTTPAPTAPPTTAELAHIGSTIAVKGLTGPGADVTLLAIIDPASGADEFTTPSAGSRFVGVKWEIKTTGSGTLSDDANNDTSLIGSDDQTYQPDFSTIAGCTNFDDGMYTIPSGQESIGCVTFQVPDAVKPAKVQFSLGGGFGGVAGQWIAK